MSKEQKTQSAQKRREDRRENQNQTLTHMLQRKKSLTEEMKDIRSSLSSSENTSLLVGGKKSVFQDFSE